MATFIKAYQKKRLLQSKAPFALKTEWMFRPKDCERPDAFLRWGEEKGQRGKLLLHFSSCGQAITSLIPSGSREISVVSNFLKLQKGLIMKTAFSSSDWDSQFQDADILECIDAIQGGAQEEYCHNGYGKVQVPRSPVDNTSTGGTNPMGGW